MLAEYGGLDMDAAFSALRSYARDHNVKLSVAAADLVGRRLSPADVVAPGSR